ncbi:MAG: sugar phosphate isomerase/epimerase [Ruminococcaceae bacterium]|nr:sugar phosphate isomerase/epimerase [Oscillospiraceae bacterium]
MFKNLGVQLYTVRDYLQDPEFADLAFAKLRALGYTEAHTAGNAFDAKLFGELLQKHGIAVIGTHYSWEDIQHDPEKTMEIHRMWGTTNIGIGGMPSEPRRDLNALKDFIRDFNKAAELYAKHGFRTTYHNHNFEFIRIDGKKTIMDLLYEGLDPATTSFVLDTCWVAAGGGDVVDWMEKLEGRIDILHLKDMYLKRDKDEKHLVPAITEVGNGSVAWDRVLKAAEKIGVKHYVVEQDNNWAGTPFNSLKISADFLAKYMK